jgi:hypothetical protein
MAARKQTSSAQAEEVNEEALQDEAVLAEVVDEPAEEAGEESFDDLDGPDQVDLENIEAETAEEVTSEAETDEEAADELEGDEVPSAFKESTAAAALKEATAGKHKSAKPKKEPRAVILTPFKLTSYVNQRLEEEGVLNLATGKPKTINSPMVYIYAGKGAFDTHPALDGSGRMECDEESAFKWAEEYVARTKEKYLAARDAMLKQLAEQKA